MAYNSFFYLGILVPAALLLYAILPARFRKYWLLAVSWGYFFLLSKKLIIYLIGTTVFVYLIGRIVDRSESRNRSKETTPAGKQNKDHAGLALRNFLTGFGIIALFAVLLYVKYMGFFVESINAGLAGSGNGQGAALLPVVSIAAPIGISYYTLEAAGYLIEVRWERVKPEHSFVKLALFLSFFPQIMEGPIALYTDTADQLVAGERIREQNLVDGTLRIIWGLGKKLIIADRLNTLVAFIYNDYTSYHGLAVALGGLAYTIQLYMEFSGVCDIIIGSALLFGIRLPENFRQPFFSESASEFWRRWHITLGTWLKTYVFYPVTTSKLVTRWTRFARKQLKSRYIGKVGTFALALFPVWFFNGVWHGPQWNYLVYGMYYFVLLLLEIILEPVKTSFYKKTGLKKNGNLCIWFRRVRTWCIIVLGEMFFRADNLTQGVTMVKNLFVGPAESAAGIAASAGAAASTSAVPASMGISAVQYVLSNAGLDRGDYLVILLGAIVVFTADWLREKKTPFLEIVKEKHVPVRWACYLALIFAVILFGAYGTGYQAVDLIYAGF